MCKQNQEVRHDEVLPTFHINCQPQSDYSIKIGETLTRLFFTLDVT